MPSVRAESVRRAVESMFQAAGRAKLAAMRAARFDPSQDPEAQRRRAATASQRRRAVVSWRDDRSLDGIDLERDILLKLQLMPTRRRCAVEGGCRISGIGGRSPNLASQADNLPERSASCKLCTAVCKNRAALQTLYDLRLFARVSANARSRPIKERGVANLRHPLEAHAAASSS